MLCRSAALVADPQLHRRTLDILGIMGDNMAGGDVAFNIIRRCNRNDFDAEPTTAGFKMTRTFAGLTIRHNHIEDVADGSGIWLDIHRVADEDLRQHHRGHLGAGHDRPSDEERHRG